MVNQFTQGAERVGEAFLGLGYFGGKVRFGHKGRWEKIQHEGLRRNRKKLPENNTKNKKGKRFTSFYHEGPQRTTKAEERTSGFERD
jgi:hypothetical protein